MKNLIIILLLALSATTFAQTGIGTTTPDASAQLDVTSTNKGFLPPRVALTSTTAFAPLAAHVAGMIVYNTATVNDVTPGLYSNNGSQWVALTSGSSLGSRLVGTWTNATSITFARDLSKRYKLLMRGALTKLYIGSNPNNRTGHWKFGNFYHAYSGDLMDSGFESNNTKHMHFGANAGGTGNQFDIDITFDVVAKILYITGKHQSQGAYTQVWGMSTGLDTQVGAAQIGTMTIHFDQVSTWNANATTWTPFAVTSITVVEFDY